MKRADIKLGEDYAVKISLSEYRGANATVERGTADDFVGARKVIIAFPAGFHREVTTAQVLMPWVDHEATKAREKAAAAKKRERENAAWEAKRAEERERFEQHILPAFHGLPTRQYVGHGGTPDLADYIADTMLRMGSATVTLREADLRAIADRILELQAIVQQNALVASDPPEAGHTPLTRMQVLEREIQERLDREAELQAQED